MNHRFLVFSILLYLSSISVYAQVSKNDKKIGILDSVKSDYEEWLRNEPQKSAQHDSSSIDPMQSRLPIISPEKLSPRHPPISVVIMTPKLQTEMQLAYQSQSGCMGRQQNYSSSKVKETETTREIATSIRQLLSLGTH